MPTYTLHIPPDEIVRLLRVERASAGGQPELYVEAWQDYVIEEEFDRAAYGLRDGEAYSLVSSEVVLAIEARLEQNYWVLSIAVRQDLGPRIIADEEALLGVPLSVDAFEAELLAPGARSASVRLDARTQDGKAHFDRWWADLVQRHAAVAAAGGASRPVAEPAGSGPGATTRPDAATAPETGALTYRSREAVAVFADGDALEAAVTALGIAGFDRAAISVLGAEDKVRARIGRVYAAVAEIEDDPRAPRAAFVSRGTRLEGEAAAVVVPFYLGGLAGAAAVVASGGALAAAIAGTILASAAGGGLGALLARAVAQHHRRHIVEQLEHGGLVLWVGVRTEAEATHACDVLRDAGGRDVHLHDVRKSWGPPDRPLSQARVDPFLEPEPRPGAAPPA